MRRWIGLIAVLMGILVMIAVIFGIGRGIVSLLNGLGDAPIGPDPMYDLFPEEVSRETRPPQLSGEDEAEKPVAEDHSDQWVYEELTPIDDTEGEP